jgi:hypothetical protein
LGSYGISLTVAGRYSWLSGDFETADEQFHLGFESLIKAAKLEGVDQEEYYNMSCYWAIRSEAEKAFPILERCLKNKAIEWSHVNQDPDWDELRGHERYLELEAEYANSENKDVGKDDHLGR